MILDKVSRTGPSKESLSGGSEAGARPHSSPVGDLKKLFHFGSGFPDSGFVANRKICSLSKGQPLLLCSACGPVEMPSIAASSGIFSPIEDNSKEFLLVH